MLQYYLKQFFFRSFVEYIVLNRWEFLPKRNLPLDTSNPQRPDRQNNHDADGGVGMVMVTPPRVLRNRGTVSRSEEGTLSSASGLSSSTALSALKNSKKRAPKRKAFTPSAPAATEYIVPAKKVPAAEKVPKTPKVSIDDRAQGSTSLTALNTQPGVTTSSSGDSFSALFDVLRQMQEKHVSSENQIAELQSQVKSLKMMNDAPSQSKATPVSSFDESNMISGSPDISYPQYLQFMATQQSQEKRSTTQSPMFSNLSLPGCHVNSSKSHELIMSLIRSSQQQRQLQQEHQMVNDALAYFNMNQK